MIHRMCYLLTTPTEDVRTAPRFYSMEAVLAAFTLRDSDAAMIRACTSTYIDAVYLRNGAELIFRYFDEAIPEAYSSGALALGQRTVDALCAYASAVREAEQAEFIEPHHLRAVNATRAACSIAFNLATLFKHELFEPGASRYQHNTRRPPVPFSLWLCNLGDRIATGVGADAIECDANDLATNMGLEVKA